MDNEPKNTPEKLNNDASDNTTPEKQSVWQIWYDRVVLTGISLVLFAAVILDLVKDSSVDNLYVFLAFISLNGALVFNFKKIFK